MLSMRSKLLLAAGICAATSTGTYAAPGDIWGGGASVIAPYWRQTNDCFALPTDLITKSSVSGGAPTLTPITPFNYAGYGSSASGAQNCATTQSTSKYTVYYVSATSGTGILAQFSHNPQLWGYVNSAGTQYAPDVDYNISETPLAQADVNIWNEGGTETQGSSSVTVVAPGGTPGTGQYGNPLQLYGPLVQFPISIDPLPLAYSPVYEKVLNTSTNQVTSYSFHINKPNADGSGGLRLSPTVYCGILNGQITNWNNAAIKALNGNKSLEDPNDPTPAASWSVPIELVGRGDSAGTTSTLTRHLSAVCPALVTGNNYSTGTSTLPSALRGNTYSTSNPNYPGVGTAGKFTLATGNSGIAQYVAFTAAPGGSNPNTIVQGRIAYLSADYVLPYVNVTATNTYGLNTAVLENSSGHWIEPGPHAALLAFGSSSLPPQSTSSGAYDASATGDGYRSQPWSWVESTDPTAPIADPTAAGAYPVVGTANFLGYQCYATNYPLATIQALFRYFEVQYVNTDATNGILASAGDEPLPPAWRTAIRQTFVTDPNGLGLAFSKKGSGTTCSAAGIVGG